ncbi:MAG: PRC-barrel domain-containing protein [Candidatus Buchananbacteria bacterium]
MLATKEIIGLPVYTQTRQYLGRVIKIILDQQTQTPQQYVVRKTGWLKTLVKNSLIINQQQVVSITSEEMIVVDTTTPIPVATEIKLASESFAK